MEASREWCRTMCFHLGITMETDSASELWLVLTMAKARMAGFPGDDISLRSMCPSSTRMDLNYLQQLNVYQKNALLDDLKCLETLLQLLEDVAPARVLVWQVKVLGHDVKELIG
eukprot:Skav200439  [mRNA]  locus=scaffold578:141796:142137:- [translate_table: standard]